MLFTANLVIIINIAIIILIIIKNIISTFCYMNNSEIRLVNNFMYSRF